MKIKPKSVQMNETFTNKIDNLNGFVPYRVLNFLKTYSMSF